MTPLELINAKRCTPGCISATTIVTRCKCPCRGLFHALVTGSDVTALVDARRTGLDRQDDLEVVEDAAA